MRIGINTGRGSIEEAVASVRRAEQDGFATAVFSNIFSLDAMTACAVTARDTERIELVTGVVPIFLRHPFGMAQQALSTHDACEGRFTLGIGLSHQVVVESMWGLSYGKPVSHTREYLEILRSLFDTGSVSHAGEHYTVNATLERPRDDRPDVLFAALGPQMLRVTGELAEGTITWMCGERTLADHIVPAITQAAEAAGRPRPRVAAGLPVCVTADPDAARARAGDEFSVYGGLPSYRAMLDREGAEDPGGIAIVGDEDEVRAAFGRIRDAGVTELGAAPFGAEDERRRTYEVVSSLARDGL